MFTRITEHQKHHLIVLVLFSYRITRYTHAHQVPHAEHMESSKMAKLEALARQCRAVLRLSVHESASEVNRSGGDAQVVSCHRYGYLVVFHPFVEHFIKRDHARERKRKQRDTASEEESLTD